MAPIPNRPKHSSDDPLAARLAPECPACGASGAVVFRPVGAGGNGPAGGPVCLRCCPDRPPGGRGPELTGLVAFVRGRLAAGGTGVYAEAAHVAERVIFAEALGHCGHNLSRAARALGISRTTLRARMAALGLTLARTTALHGR